MNIEKNKKEWIIELEDQEKVKIITKKGNYNQKIEVSNEEGTIRINGVTSKLILSDIDNIIDLFKQSYELAEEFNCSKYLEYSVVFENDKLQNIFRLHVDNHVIFEFKLNYRNTEMFNYILSEIVLYLIKEQSYRPYFYPGSGLEFKRKDSVENNNLVFLDDIKRILSDYLMGINIYNYCENKRNMLKESINPAILEDQYMVNELKYKRFKHETQKILSRKID